MLSDCWGFPAGTLPVFRAERMERQSLVGPMIVLLYHVLLVSYASFVYI